MTTLSTHQRMPAWLPLMALLLLIAGAFATVLLLSRRAAAPDVPPEPPAFQPPGAARPISVHDVQQVVAGRLTLSDGSRDVPLAADVRVEVLRPTPPEEVRIGDWLAVIGIANEVRNFSIRSLVLIPGGGPPDAEGVVRSPGGFAGHEASRDQAERPLLGGVVTASDGRTVTLQGPTGSVRIDLAPNAPLRRLAEGRPDEVREGDRIAFVGSGRVGDARAVLVLPGGGSLQRQLQLLLRGEAGYADADQAQPPPRTQLRCEQSPGGLRDHCRAVGWGWKRSLTGVRLEGGVPELHRDGTAAQLVSLQPSGHLRHQSRHLLIDARPIRRVFGEGRLGADGLGLALRANLARVGTVGEVVKHQAPFAEAVLQPGSIERGEVTDRTDAGTPEPFLRLRTDTPEPGDRQRRQERALGTGGNDDETVRLAQV